MTLYEGLAIDGQRIDAGGGEITSICNPATGDVIAEVASATANDIDQAVSVAADRFQSWRRTSPRERGEVLRRIADLIRRDGPIRYADLIGGRQNIILQHIGEDDDAGWYAFDLIRPGQPDECQLEWIADDLLFRDPCDGTELPGIGTGQPGYPVEIENGRISIDFRGPADVGAAGDGADEPRE